MAKAACVFATFNWLIHVGLLAPALWYFIAQLEQDFANAELEIKVAGITVAVDQQLIQQLVTQGDNAQGGMSYDEIMNIIYLAVKLVGTIPIGVGTLACTLILIGQMSSKSCSCGIIYASIISALSSILYLLLMLVGVGIVVVANDEQVIALVQESLTGNIDLQSIVGATPKLLDNALRSTGEIDGGLSNRQLDLASLGVDTSDVDVDAVLGGDLESLLDSELGSLVSSIDVAQLNAAIPEVDLESIIDGGTIDLSNSEQLQQLADALRDVDLEQALDNFVSDAVESFDIGNILQDSGILRHLEVLGIIILVVHAVLFALQVANTHLGCQAKSAKNKVRA